MKSNHCTRMEALASFGRGRKNCLLPLIEETARIYRIGSLRD